MEEEYHTQQLQPSSVLNIAEDQRVGLRVRNLTVSVKSQQKKVQDTESNAQIASNILDDVSFDLECGQLMAIMGGSGSGKTTLLNTLSQRTNITNKNLLFSGTINYETSNTNNHIKHAYLLQTDIFLPGLTLWETLSTQADLRLPPHVTKQEKVELIEYILNVLELAHLRDTQVAAFGSHGSTLSGGEQRRVSLAIQLLSKPAILFLDEPTTGLDTSSSLKMIHVLKKLASPEYGLTIILSIHQPRPEITELFDKICLLTRGGRLVYFGNLPGADEYFNNIHFLKQEEEKDHSKNIIEYIMDLSVKDTTSKEKEQQTVARINKLVGTWKSTHPYTSALVNEGPDLFHKNLKLFTKPKSDKISFQTELVVLTKRTFILTYRDYKALTVFNAGSVILAITIGWMFYRPKHDLAGIRSLISTLYVALEVMGFVPMYIEIERLWTTDGAFFYREYLEGQSSIIGFLLSRRLGKLFLEDLPMTLLFSIITYFMWGLNTSNGSHFGIYFTIILLIEFCCMNVAMLSFAIAPNFAISSLIANLTYQIQNNACGYFVNAATMPVYVRWTRYLAYFWYSFGALTNNQFHNWFGDCPYDGRLDDPRCEEYSGNYQIELLGFPTGWIGAPIGYLCIWVVGYLVISGIVFHFKSHDIGMAKIKKNKIGGEEDEEHAHKQKQTSGEQEYITDKHDLEINISNIYLEIRNKNWMQKVTSTKTLLDNVSATFEANKVNVIMGPSGSGKTTLLNYLSNRLSRTVNFVSQGSIKINGCQEISRDKLAKISAYVTQHDNSLIDVLTVRETLYYQAKLRLPLDQHHSIPVIINKLIRQTGLVDCADTLVGSEYTKGISGGEKRRLSIAVQLLSRPKVLFLDEPTSGLDSATAETILLLLDEVAKENNTTVILTIHQPSENMFYRFGSLLLLGTGGKVIYDGCSQGIIDYLNHLGYTNPKGNNIADYILDLVSKGLEEDKQQLEKRIDDLICHWKTSGYKITQGSIVTYLEEVIDLPQYYYKRLPIFVTFPTIIKRQLLTSYRCKDVVINRAGQTIFLAIVHTLYFAPLRNSQDGISNRLGLVQEVLNLYFAGLVNNVTLYPHERDLFYQEYRDGIYGVTEFGFSYFINELPTEIIPCLFFSALIVFAVGLPRTAGMFFAMFGTGFISLNCGESLGIFVNSLFNHLGVATNVLTTLIILAIFMGGTMSLHMPHFFKAWNYINPMKYAVAICTNLGFENQKFSCNADSCLLNTGEDVLKYYNLEQDMGAMIGGLIACFVVYRAIAIFSIYVRVKWF
ncbi:hypothetical protein Cantr_05196 [Candida viswanathii]|uniref:ABC transporter domain-containing protein n=1 Tax=Candida viswanathii TaxID=5486 RepID=A0A367XSP8_9ASCO|nr:hypothetical protein Cantr_05196 [Candida viswanathii]